jgi:hypothetical protein
MLDDGMRIWDRTPKGKAFSNHFRPFAVLLTLKGASACDFADAPLWGLEAEERDWKRKKEN